MQSLSRMAEICSLTLIIMDYGFESGVIWLPPTRYLQPTRVALVRWAWVAEHLEMLIMSAALLSNTSECGDWESSFAFARHSMPRLPTTEHLGERLFHESLLRALRLQCSTLFYVNMTTWCIMFHCRRLGCACSILQYVLQHTGQHYTWAKFWWINPSCNINEAQST